MCILLTKQKSFISRKTRQVINQRPLNLEVETRALTFIPTCLITNMKFFVSYIFVLNDKGIAQVQSICIFGTFIFFLALLVSLSILIPGISLFYQYLKRKGTHISIYVRELSEVIVNKSAQPGPKSLAGKTSKTSATINLVSFRENPWMEFLAQSFHGWFNSCLVLQPNFKKAKFRGRTCFQALM